LAWIGLDLAAKVGDVVIDDPVGGKRVGRPSSSQELFAV
jgi:hypothetical protein